MRKEKTTKLIQYGGRGCHISTQKIEPIKKRKAQTTAKTNRTCSWKCDDGPGPPGAREGRAVSRQPLKKTSQRRSVATTEGPRRSTPECGIVDVIPNFIPRQGATKGGQNTFYSIQTQSLICKSDNTPNYQVNMAILYGRWKEVLDLAAGCRGRRRTRARGGPDEDADSTLIL